MKRQNGFAIVLLMLSQRDFEHQRDTTSVKILYLNTFLFGFIFYSYYTAVLTSLMVTETKPIPIKSFDDVVERGLTVTTWEKSLMENNLKFSPKGSSMKIAYENSLKHCEQRGTWYESCSL